jgi:tetratricopeptide (TPR) repeat protein
MGRFGRWASQLAMVGALLAITPHSRAQGPDESPQALIVAATGGYLARQGTLTELTARPGMVAFSGDSLRAGGQSITFITCGSKLRQTLSADGAAVFSASGVSLRKGRFTEQMADAGCYLPSMPRSMVASRLDAAGSVSQQMARGLPAQTFEQRFQLLPEEKRNRLAAEMAPLDASLLANPGDPLRHLAKADLFSRSDLPWDAAQELEAVTKSWPDATWALSRKVTLEETAARGFRTSEQKTSEGQIYALLVGISKFQDPDITALHYAHSDAIDFQKLLESPRGGIPEKNIVRLINEEATRSAIQSAIEKQLLPRAGSNDTILLFVASHGMTVPVNGEDKGFIVAYDSTAKDLATTGIPMEDIQSLFDTRLVDMKRLLLYVDVCHAGKVGEVQIRNRRTVEIAQKSLAPRSVQMFGMLATQANGDSLEGPQFGGGHGAFSYFLINGLNGAADEQHRGAVNMADLDLYLPRVVHMNTGGRQLPKQIGTVDEQYVLADLSKPGIVIQAFGGTSEETADASRRSLTPAGNETPAVLQQFRDAVRGGRILPTDNGSAFGFLSGLRRVLPPEEYQAEQEQLRIALEDAGQQVLLKYLAGEAVAQNRADFVRGDAYFEAAKLLSPDSVYLESRALFCRGRAALFEKNYSLGTQLLERSVNMDPLRAYAYNGLGIAALEEAEYDRAIRAFRDAAARAPYWAYPLHNLALAYTERGDYANAIDTYRRAIQLAPRAAYLPYNLGLLYQRTNRPRDAEKLYRQAQALDPDNAQAANALGSLKAFAGKTADAERLYRQALALDPHLRAARYNLALLLANDPRRATETIALWRENLAADSEDVASRLALAEFLVKANRLPEAAQEYESALAAKPDYVAARVALAELNLKLGKPAEALEQLQTALKTQPDDWEVLERAAESYRALGRTAEAKAAYQKALDSAPDASSKKDVRIAMKGMQ